MSSDFNTRLLFPILRHLKTDPVVMKYEIFSQAYASILCLLSFMLTNVCLFSLYRSMFSNVRRDNTMISTFFESMDRILKEEIVEDDDESIRLDENDNEVDKPNKSNADEVENNNFDETDAFVSSIN